MKTLLLIPIILAVTFISCNHKEGKAVDEHPDWKTLSLPAGWTIQTPEHFTAKRAQGIDSYPGYIESDKDSFYLTFDSGIELPGKSVDCNFTEQVRKARMDIESGFWKLHYNIPETHKGYIDTIDNLVATIIFPSITGKGTTRVSIKDCNSGAWLGIDGDSLSAEHQTLVLEMFSTIKQKD